MENPEYWFVGKGWRIFHLEMGILERLNRTLKWDFVFWHELDTFEDLQKLDSELTTGTKVEDKSLGVF